MNWIDGMKNALDYIEANLDDELEIESIAKRACVSAFYFQKAFAMLCGFTAGEYIRKRRLALAGIELLSTDNRIIDIAVKYGYDSPDSFTRAFTRFHGSTPTAVRKEGAVIKAYAPLKIKFTLEGGITMEYKIAEKEAFTVIGVSEKFKFDRGYTEVPKFWDRHYQSDKCKTVCGVYGISFDNCKDKSEFEYMIADDYAPYREIPDGFTAHTFEKGTWAVFVSRGPLPETLQSINTKIFSEWLPNCKEYELAGTCSIEMYSNPTDFEKGNLDDNYYAEMWIPVRKR